MSLCLRGFLLSGCCIIIALYLLFGRVYKETNLWKKFSYGILSALFFCGAYITLSIYEKLTSVSHTHGSLFQQYLAYAFLRLFGLYRRRKLEKDTKNVSKIQLEILLQRLKYNAGTEYGQKYKFAEVTCRQRFRQLHPLTRYDHYKDLVDRIAEGEENVLSKDRPVILSVTSGTSGKTSIIPTLQKQFTSFFVNGVSVCFDRIFTAFPGANQLQKTMKIFFNPKQRTSQAQIPVGPNSSSPARSKHIITIYTTPKPGFDIQSEPEALYVHLLFGLKDAMLGTIEANFASLVYVALVAMERDWPQLCRDIELGQLSPHLDVPAHIAKEIDRLLTPDPTRAAFLRQEFEKGFDGIAPRIWPFLNVVLAVDTGSFELYGKTLREQYLGTVPIYSPLYAATEGLIGINMWPTDRDHHYLLVPRSMFYEFIPIEHSDEAQPATLFVDQVEEGRTYEMVITNISGLYRYRFGDVVRVVRHHNQCPVVEFLYRQGQLLNVHGEKVSEDMLYDCLRRATSQWGADLTLIDYTTCENILIHNIKGLPREESAVSAPYYLIFIELQGKGMESVSPKDKIKVDDNLRQKSFVYNSFREKGSVGAAQVHLVRPGSFRKLKAYLLENTMASANQVKIPRVLRLVAAAQLLAQNLLSNNQ